MDVILSGVILILIYLLIMLKIVQIKKDNSIGNFTWGGGVMLITLYTFFTVYPCFNRDILLTTLIMLWGGRLIIHLYSRYKKGADPRFVAWEKHWGKYALLISFGWIFIAQGALMLVMSWPSILINTSTVNGLTWLDYIAVPIWIVGFFFESVGDYQLYQFMQDPENKGKIMNQGLWRYTRHPNYFGEIVMWWAIFLIALNVPWGWTAFIAPTTITILLIFFTGIPWVEKAMSDNPDYQQYKKQTSMLIPLPPKKNK